MNRNEYMQRLEELLADIPAEEREDAISYYNDYFDAGGEDNEEETIAALGSPEQLASTIKLANTDGEIVNGEFTEIGYRDDLHRGANEIDKYSQLDNSGSDKKEKKKKDPATIILIIVLFILALPIILPIAIVMLSILFSFAIAIIAVAIGLAAALVGIAVAAFATGIVGAFVAVGALAGNFMGAVTLLGVSLILIAFGLIFFTGCLNLVVKLVPPIVRGVVNGIIHIFSWIKKKLQRRA